MMPTDLELALLADRPEAIEALARGYETEWPDWYGIGRTSAIGDLTERSRHMGLPLGVVALRRGRAVGTCALTAQSGPEPSSLTPWIGGLWVAPEARRRGVASALVAYATDKAWEQGFGAVHTLTAEAEEVFRRLGWETIAHRPIDGQDYRVLRIAL
ncbi:GNAT family N-acetyltransferase [Rhizobiaceae sp. 2RAB30]